MRNKNGNSKTDRLFTLEAKEFIWDDSNESVAHGYLLQSVLNILESYGTGVQILDLGCGNGALTKKIYDFGFSIVGCDASESGIMNASKAYPDIEFFQQDLMEPLPDKYLNKFDIVISMEVVEHLLLPRRLLFRASEALTLNGSIILSTPYHSYFKNIAIAITGKFDDHWHPLRDYGHIKFFSKNSITMLLNECGYDVIDFIRAGRIPVLAKSMILHAKRIA